ncbi:von Willebrand factor A domain-containing protein 5A isoform X2 [Danio aesculapii]|uniref:von Willebrand factor A domain-containing protein 5A isoform X2 n=1 Tax=Danio aesculapii TaxID=1142201 RepID=UPI0024BF23AA|nr:von Willebrand factor A domain-containing protein 5A isoform X2 [Danio aesculapii]
MALCCGLVSEKNVPVPLKSICVQLQVRGHVSSVRATLQYVNEEERPLEALFVFPLPAEAALCSFSASVGGQDIRGELRDKQTARDEYDDGVSAGRQVFLLEESDQSADVFRLSVGCLPAGGAATVSFTYSTELTVEEDGGLRYCLPAVLNPRYTPAATGVPQVCSASVIPYSLSLTADVRSSVPIARLDCNCALEPLQFLDPQHTHAQVSLSAGHRFDKDVELLLYYVDPHQPSAVLEGGAATAPAGSLMADPLLMLSLYPEFPAAVMSSLTSHGEFIFLVDQSGSMDCPMHHGEGAQMRIESARDTLLLLLKSLPLGCYFNIYGFGSSFQAFFPQSVLYSEQTLQEALQRVKLMRANLGGTEILQPLQHIYSQACVPEHPRQLFIFTDGEVWNTRELLDLVRANSSSHRCFSFGIGEGASTALIAGMAKEGSGHAQFITGSDRMQPKVMQSLRFALQPAVEELCVDWRLPEGVAVELLSPPVRSLYQGQRALLYARLRGQSSAESDGAVMIKYKLKDTPVTNQLQFTLTPAGDTGLTVHWLAARTLIRGLEQEERVGGAEAEALRSRIVELSVECGVSSTHTAFICTHTHSGETVKGPLLQRNIPVPQMMACHGAPRRMMCAAPMARCSSRALPKMVCDSAMSPSRKLKSARVSHHSVPVGLVECDSASTHEPDLRQDPLLQLVSLQKASGSWEMSSALSAVLEKPEEELRKHTPPQADGLLWATVLSLLWLFSCKLQDRVEWQFVALKAAAWVRAQNQAGVAECVRNGNLLLDCQLTAETLGI